MINKKSYLYKKPEGKYKSKMYLIENDTVWLKKSNEGEKYFYIIYKRNGESNIEGWVLADSLQMEEDKKSEVYSSILKVKTTDFSRSVLAAILCCTGGATWITDMAATRYLISNIILCG
ncbi:hypothetical protein [Xenorhabdus szentirmaii]|uniref:hypothetical protein n=1 Tax=Xenorhabdus szentirmaii TaxID=290112 RepID=UPI000C043036|nr:hypothetical protein [Xenorhabdus szentirmaii]